MSNVRLHGRSMRILHVLLFQLYQDRGFGVQAKFAQGHC
jgi:hypothetical protein